MSATRGAGPAADPRSVDTAPTSSPRRAFLQGAAAAAFSLVAAAPAIAYDSIPGTAPGVYVPPVPLRAVPDPKVLVKDVKELDYDKELFENPDASEELLLRKKKPKPVAEYEEDARALAEKEEKLRAAKQAKEDAEAAALKAKFGK